MLKTTLVCLWWLKSQHFKIIIECLNLELKIGVLKILMLMAIRLRNTESVLKISTNELFLDSDVIVASLYWLSKIKVIVLMNEADLVERKQYLIRYSQQEQELRNAYDDCWVELPNQKVLNMLKTTANNQNITYEALSNYLMLIKGVKKNTKKIKPIYFDEDFVNGCFRGTWREILVRNELIEFWGGHHF